MFVHVELTGRVGRLGPENLSLGNHSKVRVGSFGIAALTSHLNGPDRPRLLADVRVVGGVTVFIVDMQDDGQPIEAVYQDIILTPCT